MRYAKPVIIALIVIAAIFALRFLPVGAWLKTFQAYVKSAGPMGYVVYALGYAIIALVFPGSVDELRHWLSRLPAPTLT